MMCYQNRTTSIATDSSKPVKKLFADYIYRPLSSVLADPSSPYPFFSCRFR